MEKFNLHYIDTNDDFRKVISAVQSHAQFGFDLEASDLDPFTGVLLLVQLFTGTDVYVINCGKVKSELIEYTFKLINESKKLLIGHNIKFDMRYIDVKYGVMPLYVYDTQEAETLQKAGLIGSYHKLSKLLDKYLGVKVGKDIRETFIGKTDFEFTREQIEYAATDVCYLFDLKNALDVEIKNSHQINTMELESRLLPPVVSIENNGILIDTESWEEGLKDSQKIIQERKIHFLSFVADNFTRVSKKPKNALEAFKHFAIRIPTTIKGKKELEEIIVYDEIVSKVLDNVNFNSTKQMSRLAGVFGIPEKSTNKKVIKKYPNNEFVKRLLSYREYLKDDTTYGDSFLSKINPITGRIHADFNPLGTRTGRFSSSKPNLQNIKRGNVYRERFIAPEGSLLATADYSQIELRVAAVLSHETAMIDAFNAGEDLHRLTAATIFAKDPKDVLDKERDVGKTLNFAVVYGTSVKGLYYNFEIPMDDGEIYLDRFFSKYRNLAYFINESGKRIIELGFSSTANGRRRFFTVPNNLSNRDIKKIFAIKREGVNHIVQGTSGDMIKMAICNIYYDNPFGKNLKLVNTVHDEVVVEFVEGILDEAVEFINKSMVSAGDYFLKNVVETKCGIKVNTHWSK
jgi:DNA polymerase-1